MTDESSRDRETDETWQGRRTQGDVRYDSATRTPEGGRRDMRDTGTMAVSLVGPSRTHDFVTWAINQRGIEIACGR